MSKPGAETRKRFGERLWWNGRMVPEAEAKISVMAHALHYGSAVFEGIRVYETPAGPQVFRLDAHLRRLMFSSRVYRMEVPYTTAQLKAACCEVVTDSGLRNAYVRPLVYRGLGNLGVVPQDTPIEVVIAAMSWGPYLGAGALENGVRTCVSSWTRLAANTMPTMAKAAGNYLSSQLVAMEAKRLGFDEAIALDTHGLVSEGPGENLFAVFDGALVTPPLTASILPGITRETLIWLAKEHGIPVSEQNLGREALYMADELFFAGTAVEITPINSVDDLKVADGRRGPLTKRLQDLFFGIFAHQTKVPDGWLTPL